ncbi:hypothetical protein C2845_PM18G06060 [Panicum miliaceum]|uniref:Uncharacterized protein n=1 Tax=Panicum miliaceum TaxID=4540 RepID=A0A3L6PLW9_PANMI|nr:hypothetical protein C2845_PM18G06060 [Panicum miliaceum]
MRVKQLVTSRMGNKKTTTKGDKQEKKGDKNTFSDWSYRALKTMGVTGASAMYSFQHRIQHLRKWCRFGFDYLGPEDPSRICAEELSSDDALKRVKRVLLDVTSVPYVPQLFSSKNQPVAGHINLYRSSPPLPEIPCLDHLMPSAYITSREYRPAFDLDCEYKCSDTDGDLTLADRQKMSNKDTAQAVSNIPGGGSLPSHPRKPRVTTRKHRATLISIDDDEESR